MTADEIDENLAVAKAIVSGVIFDGVPRPFCVVPALPSDQHGCTIADATALPNSARPRAD
jgi:hypothetical protein